MSSLVCLWVEARQPSFFGIAPSLSYSHSFQIGPHLHTPPSAGPGGNKLLHSDSQNTRGRASSAPPNLIVSELLMGSTSTLFNGAFSENSETAKDDYRNNSSTINSNSSINNRIVDIESGISSGKTSTAASVPPPPLLLHGILRNPTPSHKTNNTSYKSQLQLQPRSEKKNNNDKDEKIGQFAMIGGGSLSSSSSGDDTVNSDYPNYNNLNMIRKTKRLDVEEITPLLSRPAVLNESNLLLSYSSTKAKYSNS